MAKYKRKVDYHSDEGIELAAAKLATEIEQDDLIDTVYFPSKKSNIWGAHAACLIHGVSRDKFVPPDDETEHSEAHVELAEQYCAVCDVRPECAGYALLHDNTVGLAGGMFFSGSPMPEKQHLFYQLAYIFIDYGAKKTDPRPDVTDEQRKRLIDLNVYLCPAQYVVEVTVSKLAESVSKHPKYIRRALKIFNLVGALENVEGEAETNEVVVNLDIMMKVAAVYNKKFKPVDLLDQ